MWKCCKWHTWKCRTCLTLKCYVWKWYTWKCRTCSTWKCRTCYMPYMLHVRHVRHVPYTIHESVIHAARAVRMARNSQSWFRKLFFNSHHKIFRLEVRKTDVYLFLFETWEWRLFLVADVYFSSFSLRPWNHIVLCK